MRSRSDPAALADADGGYWLAQQTAAGPASLRLEASERVVTAHAWGPGAVAALDSVPELLGAGDDPTGFPCDRLPAHLATSWSRLAGRWRVPRSGRVMQALIPAILEQKVTGIQSRRAWSALLRHAGEVAPGPTPRVMHLLPDAARIRRIPSWQWHAWGVHPSQSATILRAAYVAGRIEECARLDLPAARRRLASIDGIGPWTVAEVGSRALGDADAVSFGDFHLAAQVVYSFTGARDGTDEQMAELLEPFAGHRQRVQRLVEISGRRPPARDPRATITDHRGR